MDESVKKKAELIEIGGTTVDDSFLPYKSRSTAGPGAGLESIFVNIDGHRVRLGVRQESKFSATLKGDMVTIFADGKEYARGRLEQAISHCPEQVYVTVSERCVFDCKFCSVPKLQGKIKSDEEVLELVRQGMQSPELAAISITSGVWTTPEEEAERITRVVRLIKKELDGRDIPIGVSIYATDDSSERLKEAGAAEVKYNVETVDRELFEKVCPGLSFDYIVKSLEHAVYVFGRNHVFSNILIGMGETDETVVEGMEMLASKGVIPILRKTNPHPLRAGEIKVEPVSAARLLKLASEHRRILEKHGLDTRKALTGCVPCTGCDVTPLIDL
ncbi:radical SAM protein [Methanocella sp. MCL-LM]|uniref:radical SAM protein n=1 Tax=Methanocella sp. MCL-LM TaxID=3412035 RepID=UPI003C781F47